MDKPKPSLSRSWRYLESIPSRIRLLATRTAEWEDLETGEVTREKIRLAYAWDLVRPQPSFWWWVERWGKLPCGCGRNPLTRRMAWYRAGCSEHGLEWLP